MIACNNALWWNADGSVRERCNRPVGHSIACAHIGSPGEAEKVASVDMVNEPPHYKSVAPIKIDVDAKSYCAIPAGKLEALHVIEAFGLGWHAGNVVKYLLRAGRKGPTLEDLRKAQNILGRLIAFTEQAR